ncbi:MAG: S1 RNA-binding domain-containing protein [Alistipes sp.]|nr:S1 RNA-binding domain-containing protein [Alistipes sp.]
MEYRTKFKPEGCLFKTTENLRYISSVQGMREAMDSDRILEARVSLCNGDHDLIVDFPWGKGIIPREEGALGIREGMTRDIALISRVNKPVCFKVTGIAEEKNGAVTVWLSRRAAQEEFAQERIRNFKPGDVIEAKVTHLEQFGAFVDVGCGVASMIPIDAISVSRISHPSDRFVLGQMIRTVVKAKEGTRLYLTHKELLGTWEENIQSFHVGETVSGIVRSVESYGIFVEIAPNLAGLAELRSDVFPGQSVSVYIKALIPEKMKVKLVIVDICEDNSESRGFTYFTDADYIASWSYSPKCCRREIVSNFQ